MKQSKHEHSSGAVSSWTDARLARLVQEAYGWSVSRIIRTQARFPAHYEALRGGGSGSGTRTARTRRRAFRADDERAPES